MRHEVPLISLDRLGHRGYSRLWGPGRGPRLWALRHAGEGAPFVFCHGTSGTPSNGEILLRWALAADRPVYVMAYDSLGMDLAFNAQGFAEELNRLIVTPEAALEVVGHSLGAATVKLALSRMRPPRRLHLVSIATPWGGFSFGRPLQRWPQAPLRRLGLFPLRDMTDVRAEWQALCAAPLPDWATLDLVTGGLDELSGLSGRSEVQRRNARRIEDLSRARLHLPGAAHNTLLWDPRLRAWLEGRDAAQDPPPQDRLSTVWSEVRAVMGLPGSFVPPDRDSGTITTPGRG